MVITKTYNYCPESLCELIWDTFYQKRNRGVSMSVHSPWLFKNCGFDAICAFSDQRELLGGAILKAHNSNGGPAQGLLGYVCVKESFRRQGVSTDIIKSAITCAQNRKYSGITLWTQSPAVYLKHGFEHNAREYLAYYTKTIPLELSKESTAYEIIPRDLSETGLPAFATSIDMYVGNKLWVTTANTQAGPSVVSVNGHPPDLLNFCNYVFTEGWWLNGDINDPFILWLNEAKYIPDKKIESCRYDLILDKSWRVAQGPINILERI